MNTFNYGSDAKERTNFPKSPEAAAFEKYGNTSVNLYNGTPNIAVPIHTLKGRELEVPISLTYDASGVKVEQLATNVGLNWNLNVGGRISRIPNGRPDDIMQLQGPFDPNFDQAFFDNVQNYDYPNSVVLKAHFDALQEMSQGCKDLLIDIYSLNALGINDYIVINFESHEAFTLLNPRIKVAFSALPPTAGTEWTVTDENGNTYIFGQDNFYEQAEIEGVVDSGDIPCPSFNMKSTMSWALTQVISKNGLDVFNFTYNKLTWFNKRQGGKITSKTNSRDIHGVSTWDVGSNNFEMYTNYETTQLMLSEIQDGNNVRLVDFTYKSREDILYENDNPGAVDKIRIYKFNYTNLPEFESPIFKTITFNHSYFGDPTMSYIYKRLKLEDIVISEGEWADGNNSQKYSFGYFGLPSEVPPTTSNAQDFLGLYNGVTGNTSLIPALTEYTGTPLPGANRSFVLGKAIIGTLETITYPTGGYTKFEFEKHSVRPGNTSPTNFTEWPVNFGCGVGTNAGYIHTMMSEASGVRSEVVYLSGTYKVEFSGIGRFLIHKPICMDDMEQTEDYNRSPMLSNPVNIAPSCRHYEPVPTQNVFVVGSISNASPGSVLTGIISPSPLNFYFRPGYYQVTVWNRLPSNGGPGPGGPSPLPPSGSNLTDNNPHIDISRTYPIYPSNVDAPGFRIKTIRDYTSNLNASRVLATEKEYKYLDDINIPISSGRQIVGVPNPGHYYTKKLYSMGMGAPDLIDVEHVTRTGAGIENNPHVIYTTVYEVNTVGGIFSGYTRNQFSESYEPEGLVSTNGVKSFEPIHGGKLLSKTIYDKNHKLVSGESYQYEFRTTDAHFGGYTAATDYDHIGEMFGWWRCGGSDTMSQIWLPVQKDCFQSNCNIAAPSVFTSPTAASLCDNFTDNGYNAKIGGYALYLLGTSFKSSYSNVIRKTTTNYSYVNNVLKSVSNEEQYNYAQSYPYLLRNKVHPTTDNLSIYNQPTNQYVNTSAVKTEYSYLDDNPEKITDIKVFKVTNTAAPELLSHRNNTYADFGGLNGTTSNYLNEVKISKGNQPLETRVKYDYNSSDPGIGDGNIKESIQLSDTNFRVTDSYIFGYNDQFPVAKISGMPYSDINPDIIADIKYWSNLPVIEANVNGLRNKFEELRNLYPQAQITTYTYNPDKGVTSETNPKGITTYYEYDELGRLKRVKDNDRNIISENEYHYRNQN